MVSHSKRVNGVNEALSVLPILFDESPRAAFRSILQEENEAIRLKNQDKEGGETDEEREKRLQSVVILSRMLRANITNLLKQCESVFGVNLNELTTLALGNIDHSGEALHDAAKEAIRKRIIDVMPVLAQFVKECDKKRALRRYGRDANGLVKKIVNKALLGSDQGLQRSDVTDENDPVELILLAANPELANELRFEAARKLAYALNFMKQDDPVEEDEVGEDGLSKLNTFYNECVYQPEPGKKLGSTTTMYVLSTHDADDQYISDKAELLAEPPDSIGEFQKLTPVEVRRLALEDDDGNERIIYAIKGSREKERDDIALKKMRYGRNASKRENDENGERWTFRNIEELNLFSKCVLKRMMSRVKRKMEKMIANLNEEILSLQGHSDDQSLFRIAFIKEKIRVLNERLSNPKADFVMSEYKDTLSGGRFEGNSPNSSERLRIRKFKLKIRLSDGIVREFEFQLMLLEGFSDLHYADDINIEEYTFSRLHKDVLRSSHPSNIFRKLDKEAIRARGISAIRENNWPNRASHQKEPICVRGESEGDVIEAANTVNGIGEVAAADREAAAE